MKIKIIKRTFLATHFPVEFKDRERLNGHPLTSEYFPAKKYAVYQMVEETERSVAHTRVDLFETKLAATIFAESLIQVEAAGELKK